MLSALKWRWDYFRFRRALPGRLRALRAKDKIKCVFVLNELSIWKHEALFQAMLAHERFDPLICIAMTQGVPAQAADMYHKLHSYVAAKGYPYVEELDIAKLGPDIAFYEKPYDGDIASKLWFRNNPGHTMYISYGFNNLNTPQSYNVPQIVFSSMFFVENELVKKKVGDIRNFLRRSVRVTGVPMEDYLLGGKDECEDPWKPQDRPKKRIIWAPHFSIGDRYSWLGFGSFLNICDAMTRLAEERRDDIQIAFKPHPLLFRTLIAEWGQEKAEAYYRKWEEMPNTQVETGEYIGLFKHSDAMVHDSGSFLMEYMYMNKPVLYTLRSLDSLQQMNEFGLMAYDNCYHGNTPEVIEEFINNVIAGVDPMKAQREKFYSEHLLPPNGKTACENIIDAILGQNGYE